MINNKMEKFLTLLMPLLIAIGCSGGGGETANDSFVEATMWTNVEADNRHRKPIFESRFIEDNSSFIQSGFSTYESLKLGDVLVLSTPNGNALKYEIDSLTSDLSNDQTFLINASAVDGLASPLTVVYSMSGELSVDFVSEGVSYSAFINSDGAGLVSDLSTAENDEIQHLESLEENRDTDKIFE